METKKYMGFDIDLLNSIGIACNDDDIDYFLQLISLKKLKALTQEQKDYLLLSCFDGGYVSEFRIAKIILDIGANINHFITYYGDYLLDNFTILWLKFERLKSYYYVTF